MSKEPINVAIIGAGISGLTAGWLLSQDPSAYRITLFDSLIKNGLDFQGLEVAPGDKLFQNTEAIRIDVPFRFHVPNIYLNFTQMCRVLGVKTHKYEQHLMVCDKNGSSIMNYSTASLFGFSIPVFSFWNYFSPLFWSTLWQLYWFRVASWEEYLKGSLKGKTFGDYLTSTGQTQHFQDYILSYLSFVCTCDFEVVRNYPAELLVRFCHDMTAGIGLYQFTHGTKDVSDRLEKPIQDRRYNTMVAQIVPSEEQVDVHLTDGTKHKFDRVILATQPDVTAKLLKGIDSMQKEVELLQQFPVVSTAMTIHTDHSLLPNGVTYNDSPKNILQTAENSSLAHKIINKSYPFMSSVKEPLLIQTWALHNPAKPDTVIHSCYMKRQTFTVPSLGAISQLDDLQGKNNIWFCGGYTIPTVPLLESGVVAAAALLMKWGVKIPWNFVPLPARLEGPRVPLFKIFVLVAAGFLAAFKL